MLVWNQEQYRYEFKEIFRIKEGDRLIKQNGDDLTEVTVESIEQVKENVEIVSINVEDVDTYLVNGYITHNKGGNSHTDESARCHTNIIAWNNSTRTLSWSGDGTNDVFDIQVDDTSTGFGSLCQS